MRPALLTLPLLFACESVDSTDVETSGMYADIRATASGDGQTATTVTLRVGGAASNTYVQLNGDDTLTATFGDESQQMGDNHLGDAWWYSAWFDVEQEDSTFTFSLERTTSESAPASTASLPALFEIAAPEADTAYSRTGDDITVSWSPSGTQDEMVLQVGGDCAWTFDQEITGDPGVAVVEAGSVTSPDGRVDETCTGQITLIRRRVGTIDPAFGEGGLSYGQQTRVLDIMLEP